jgi:hypothetical protein
MATMRGALQYKRCGMEIGQFGKLTGLRYAMDKIQRTITGTVGLKYWRSKTKMFGFIRSAKSKLSEFLSENKFQETRIDTEFPQQLMKTLIWQRANGSKYIVILSNQHELATKIALNPKGAIQLRNALSQYLVEQSPSSHSD